MIRINVLVDNDEWTKISIYFLDWWRGDASVNIRVYSSSSDVTPHSFCLSNSNEGVYVYYIIKGHVRFEINPTKVKITMQYNGNCLDEIFGGKFL